MLQAAPGGSTIVKCLSKTHDNGLPVFVVDEHHDAFKVIAHSVKAGFLSGNKLKMLHFDSHPDLGVCEDKGRFVKDLAADSYSVGRVHSHLDISSWIIPLVLAGHLDTVAWVGGHWCDQLKPGSYDMLCGINKKTGRGAISVDSVHASSSRYKKGVIPYYEIDGVYASVDELSDVRRWRLDVFICSKSGKFTQRDEVRFMDLFGCEEDWILDIDEDYFSCNNPFLDEFTSLFGDKDLSALQLIFQSSEVNDVDIELLVKSTEISRKRFIELPEVKKIQKNLDSPKAKQSLLQFYDMFRRAERDSKNRWNMSDVMKREDFVDIGNMLCLPHHISKMDEITAMVNSVHNLLLDLSRPRLVTVATSRADRYLPDPQAAHIHRFTTILLKDVYETRNIARLDKPKLSVFAFESASESSDSESSDSNEPVEIPSTGRKRRHSPTENKIPAKRIAT
eukprot:173318_1